MKVDILGSKFMRKLTEFKNFRFEVNNAVLDQSILSLLSDPYEVAMKDINTTNLNDITVAYRDLNKLLYPNLKSSNSEVIMVELLSELNDISEFEHSFYNTSSLELLNEDLNHKNMSTIEKFRALQRKIDELIRLLNQYEKVIFLKLLPQENEEKDFIEGLYHLLESKVKHKLTLSIDNHYFDEDNDVPLEVYNQVNDDLRKFSSDNYHNQLLFDESLEDNKLSVYINYVEEREYVYELYKNGKPYKKADPTTSRFYEFTLEEPGKYRIRVNLSNEEIKPRFTQTYVFQPEEQSTLTLEEYKYIELPSKNNLWMLDVILQKHKFLGLIGNAYLYPRGYAGYKVFLPEEVNDSFITKDELFDTAIKNISDMSSEKFNYFIKSHPKLQYNKPLVYNFLAFINKYKS
ncbi:DUF6270 domain-containing protein [Salinicoccus sp. YB14-2]|uniref:DUF6270 domain-containing protein n=1 Tax=Salinicoccus sp. YB14-2 TaxID=1572701 RepID=UPI00068D2E09|nr:DUF6270 domain-containing protein [Salinicoccus sp. YB14-2]